MDPYNQKIIEYLRKHEIEAEHLRFEQSCHSVAEAAEAAGASPKDFVKSICLLSPTGELVVAIVKGEDRVSRSRVAKALEIERPRLASPEEILEKTGYPCGGTPAFGYTAHFLVDPRVVQKTEVYTGGGTTQSLIRISPTALLAANGGTVVRIRG